MTKNKDGFEAGADVSPEDYFAHIAKLRQKPEEEPVKRGRPKKAAD